MPDAPPDLTPDQMIDHARLSALAARLHDGYLQASPFPHCVVEEILRLNFAAAVTRAFDDLEWENYIHFNENKQCTNNALLPPPLRAGLAELNSPRFLAFLSRLTGIENLIPDTELGSGGLQQSSRGGFLNIHADFTVHPFHQDWRRRINVLIYLNDHWDEAWGGALELWDSAMRRCETRILPVFNRSVIFNTSETSYHGHPMPMTCPEGVFRRSIAMYYYTEDRETVAISTDYRPRPEDNMLSAAMIYVDKMLLRFFYWIKRRTAASDLVVTRMMKIFKRRH